MKGLLSSSQVIAEMGIQLDRRFRDYFVARRLDIDCARMHVNAELFEVLRAMRAEAMVMIATDNMDCFARAFEQARRRRHSTSVARATLADWAVICDDTICSSHLAVLKAEGPQAFFGPWLARHGVAFADAVLIDDRADNCAAFTAHGGTSVQWRMGTDDISDATGALKRWLDAATHVPGAVKVTCAALRTSSISSSGAHSATRATIAAGTAAPRPGAAGMS